MKERVIALIAGESGAGKSFFIANLRNCLIFDTDIGGGLSYAEERIRRNNSVRIEVGSYQEVADYLSKHRSELEKYNKVAIDHLTALHQEAALRHNPKLIRDFGAASEKAAREWRRIRELVRWGDFHLFCTAHLKGKWEEEKMVGEQADAAKKIEGDFHIVLHVHNDDSGKYPKMAKVYKWRRDPEDPRGQVPHTFPLTVESFSKIHGSPLNEQRQAVPMATPQQVEEIRRLVALVRLPEGTIRRWMAKARADDWSDFTAADLQKCIDYLRGLLEEGAPQVEGEGNAEEDEAA